MMHRIASLVALAALSGVGIATAGATTITFQEGANVVSSDGQIVINDYSGTRDTSIVQENAGLNYGGRPTLLVGVLGSNKVRSGLIGFDVTSLAGQYTSITSITLRLYVDSIHDSTSTEQINVSLEKSGNAGWVEGTGNGAAQTGTADWNYAGDSSVPWLGGENGARTTTDNYGNVATTDKLTSSTAGAGTWIDIDLSALPGVTGVQTLTQIMDLWSGNGGADNAGMILKYLYNTDTFSGTPQWSFASSEYGTQTLRPELIVNYVAAVPSPAALPGGLLLLGLIGAGRRRSR